MVAVAKKQKPAAHKKSPVAVKSPIMKPPPPPAAAPAAVKQRTVVTPWRDTAEFNETFDWLFAKGSTPANRRQALSKIRIWGLRRGNLCPAAVLATSVLVEAQLEDKAGNSSIQTTYASAFTRFYNFMSSIIQGHSMTSMYETAKELGLQSFIVDLRHLCAHGQELPPAEVLRSTVQHCVEWLRTYYWLPHKESLSNLDAGKLQRKDKLRFEKQVTALLELYDLSLECQLKGADKLKAISKLKSSAEFNKIRVYASPKQAKTTREIQTAIIADLNALIKRESHAMKDLLGIYISCLLKLEYFLGLGLGLDLQENEDEVVAAAQPLFRSLAMQGYIENYFVALLQLTENENESERRRLGARYWGLKMVQTFGMLHRMKRMYKEELDLNKKLKPVDFSNLNTDVLSNTLQSLVVHSGVDSSVTLIFGDTPKKPRKWIFERDFIEQHVGSFSKYSGPIVRALLPLSDPPYEEWQLSDLTTLCNIRLEEDDTVPTELNIPGVTNYDMDDFMELVRQAEGGMGSAVDADFVSTDTPQLGLWQIDKENDWSKCALGVLPY